MELWSNSEPVRRCPELRNGLTFLRDVLAPLGVKAFRTEWEVYTDASIGIAGSIDWVGQFPDGSLCVVDWKRTGPDKHDIHDKWNKNMLPPLSHLDETDVCKFTLQPSARSGWRPRFGWMKAASQLYARSCITLARLRSDSSSRRLLALHTLHILHILLLMTPWVLGQLLSWAVCGSVAFQIDGHDVLDAYDMHDVHDMLGSDAAPPPHVPTQALANPVAVLLRSWVAAVAVLFALHVLSPDAGTIDMTRFDTIWLV